VPEAWCWLVLNSLVAGFGSVVLRAVGQLAFKFKYLLLATGSELNQARGHSLITGYAGVT